MSASAPGTATSASPGCKASPTRMAATGRACRGWDKTWCSGCFFLAFEHLDRTLSNFNGASGHCLLETGRLCKVDVGETFALVNLDPVDGTPRLHGLLDEGLGDALGGVGMLEERLLARGSRGW